MWQKFFNVKATSPTAGGGDASTAGSYAPAATEGDSGDIEMAAGGGDAVASSQDKVCN